MDGLGRALAYIERNVEGDVDGSTLSHVAGLSRFHFNRHFSKTFGISPRDCVELIRLRRAAFRLAFQPEVRVLDIALASGFESHEAFGRAFKRVVGQTPSQFRRAPHWSGWATRSRRLTELRIRYAQADLRRRSDAELVEFPETRVVGLRYHGPRERLLDAARRFVDWRKREGLSPRTTPTFNVIRPAPFRFDFCVGTKRSVTLEPGMFVDTIPGGLCAFVRHVGPDDTIGEDATWLANVWQPQSGYRLRGGAVVLQRLRFFPDVPEREAVTDVLLPIAPR